MEIFVEVPLNVPPRQAIPPSPSYCQKVGKSVKSAFYDTVSGAFAGAVLMMPFQTFVPNPYGHYEKTRRASDVAMAALQNMRVETDLGIGKFEKPFYQVLDMPMVAGFLIGGCTGGALGLIGIFRTVLFPNAE